jgi:hypothetical protein
MDDVMDRTEAYGLLSDEMKKLTRLSSAELMGLCEAAVERDLLGAGGRVYRAELVVERIAGARFVILGKIHDNDSYSFSLLEERLVFDAGRKA